MKLTQTQKAAVVLMTLGEDLASQVLQHLSSKEVQMISGSMVSLPQISNEQLNTILDDYLDEAEQCMALNVDTTAYLRTLLTKSMGEEKANKLLNELLDEEQSHLNGLEMLNHADASSVAELIRNEHPQVIATILVHLNRDLAADTLALFDDELRNDIVLRVATFGGIQPSALQELTETLSTLLNGQSVKRNKMGGIRTAAEIINLMKSQQEEAVIDAVRDHDTQLAQKIIDEMFLFENLIDVDDRSMQRLLKEVDSETLVIALKGCDKELCDKFLKNMSQRASAILRDEIRDRPPVRLSQVETEQKNILSIARRLAKTGEIILKGGDDKYV